MRCFLAIFQNCDNPFEVNFPPKPSSGLLGWIPVIRSFENDTACEIDSAVCFCSVFLRQNVTRSFETRTVRQFTSGVFFCDKLAVWHRRSNLTLVQESLLECVFATNWYQVVRKRYRSEIHSSPSPPPTACKPISGQIFSQAPIGFLTLTTKIRAGGEGKREWQPVGCAKGCGSRGNEQQRAAETVL